MEAQSKNKFLYIVIILLLVLNLGTLSYMWYSKLNTPQQFVDRMPPGNGKEFLEEELKFSKDQREKLEQLREEHSQKIRGIKEQERKLKDSFFSNLADANLDSNKVRDNANQIGLFQKEIELATFYHVRKMRELCNDEQKKKFDEVIQDVLRMGLGPGGKQGPPPNGRRPPPPDGYKQRDGDGHINPPGTPGPEGDKPPKR